MTHNVSNEEKNGGRKSCWTVPLKRQLTTQTPSPCGQWLCRHCVRVVNNYAVIVSRFLWLRWHTFFREYLRENEKISWNYVSLFIWGSGGVFLTKVSKITWNCPIIYMDTQSATMWFYICLTSRPKINSFEVGWVILGYCKTTLWSNCKNSPGSKKCHLQI